MTKPLMSLGLLRLGTSARMRLETMLAPAGLKTRHLVLLQGLADGKDRNQQSLAREVGVHPSHVVGSVDELLKLGLIERAPADNRRERRIQLSAKGKELLPSLLKGTDDLESELAAGLTQEERTVVLQFITRALEMV
jgi:MarR family transcriptional regulator, lower aerobic nicotinate degradation pathway regulator